MKTSCTFLIFMHFKLFYSCMIIFMNISTFGKQSQFWALWECLTVCLVFGFGWSFAGDHISTKQNHGGLRTQIASSGLFNDARVHSRCIFFRDDVMNVLRGRQLFSSGFLSPRASASCDPQTKSPTATQETHGREGRGRVRSIF